MPDRRDDIDSWLDGRVDPLPPPPGTFDLIKRRARRRKYRTLGLGAAAAAVIVAAVIAVPQVVRLPVSGPVSPVQAGRAVPTATGTGSGAGTPETSASAGVGKFSAGPTPASTAPVPAGFEPTSVTFVGTDTGWVIGQAGDGHCASQYCTSLARTTDAGKTWTGVHAPLTGPAQGASGVSQVRFLNLADGWAFGPELWATTNGGQSWTQVDTDGMRVTDLETVGDRVFALFASCTGTGPAYDGCTSFTLYSATAPGGAWAPVGAATSGLTDGAASESASLLLTEHRGYLLAPGGELYAGPVDSSAPWTEVNSLPGSCPVGTPQWDGQPSGALLSAANAQNLTLACLSAGPSDADSQDKMIFSSPNGGASWLQIGTAPTAGTASSVGASPSESMVLGTDQGIYLLPAGQTSWQPATLDGTAPAGGFGYVGMTTDEQGVALPANPDSGTVWFTFDGGRDWQPFRLNGS